MMTCLQSAGSLSRPSMPLVCAFIVAVIGPSVASSVPAFLARVSA